MAFFLYLPQMHVLLLRKDIQLGCWCTYCAWGQPLTDGWMGELIHTYMLDKWADG